MWQSALKKGDSKRAVEAACPASDQAWLQNCYAPSKASTHAAGKSHVAQV